MRHQGPGWHLTNGSLEDSSKNEKRIQPTGFIERKENHSIEDSVKFSGSLPKGTQWKFLFFVNYEDDKN